MPEALPPALMDVERKKTLWHILFERMCPVCQSLLSDNCPMAYKGHLRCLSCDCCWVEKDGTGRSCWMRQSRRRYLMSEHVYEGQGSGI